MISSDLSMPLDIVDGVRGALSSHVLQVCRSAYLQQHRHARKEASKHAPKSSQHLKIRHHSRLMIIPDIMGVRVSDLQAVRLPKTSLFTVTTLFIGSMP